MGTEGGLCPDGGATELSTEASLGDLPALGSVTSSCTCWEGVHETSFNTFASLLWPFHSQVSSCWFAGLAHLFLRLPSLPCVVLIIDAQLLAGQILLSPRRVDAGHWPRGCGNRVWLGEVTCAFTSSNPAWGPAAPCTPPHPPQYTESPAPSPPHAWQPLPLISFVDHAISFSSRRESLSLRAALWGTYFLLRLMDLFL